MNPVEIAYRPGDRQLLAIAREVSGSDVAIVYFHGIESHAGWFNSAADRLAGQGHSVYCLDRRGSGINRENRGFPSGHADSWNQLLDDVGPFVNSLKKKHTCVFLAGLSWGGKLALAHAMRHPAQIDGVALITPGLRARVDVSTLDKLKILFGSTLSPRTAVQIPIEPEMFTVTPEHLSFIKSDPLRLHSASARFLMSSRRLDNWITQHIGSHSVPTLLFLAGRDRIIDNGEVVRLLERASADLEIHNYEDQTHSIQFDAPDRLTTHMNEWIQRHLTRIGAST